MDAKLPPVDELASFAARMSDLLLTHDDVGVAVRALTQVLIEAIPGSAGAGVSLMDARGQRTSTSATDPVVLEADQLQYDLRQGPCLTAWAQQTTILIDDTQSEKRWPAWIRGIAHLPLRSALSCPLSTPHGAIGALKIYSRNPGGFDSRTLRLAGLLARPGALMLANAQARDAAQHFRTGLVALKGHDALGTAMGILMVRRRCSREQAFAMLITISRERNQPLHQLAQEIVSGETTL